MAPNISFDIQASFVHNSLGYNHYVEDHSQHELKHLEHRCRVLTGIILAAIAFVVSYAIMLVEGQVDRPVFHVYPWMLAVAFYIAGNLLALVWFRAITIQLVHFLRQQQQATLISESLLDRLSTDEPREGNQVEVVRPKEVEG